MPAVRCPSCDRRLHLPEEVIGQEARCPLCGSTFPAEPEGGRPQPVAEEVRAPDPARPWRPPGESGRRAPPRSPEPRPVPLPRPRRGDDPERDRLMLAGGWLFGLSIAALAWDMTCGCGGIALLLDSSKNRDEAVLIVIMAAHAAHVAAMIVLLCAGEAMGGVRNLTLCRIGAWVAIVDPVFFLGRIAALRDSFSMRLGIDAWPLVASFLLPMALFLAGTAAVGVLARPGVQEAFARSQPSREEDL